MPIRLWLIFCSSIFLVSVDFPYLVSCFIFLIYIHLISILLVKYEEFKSFLYFNLILVWARALILFFLYFLILFCWTFFISWALGKRKTHPHFYMRHHLKYYSFFVYKTVFHIFIRWFYLEITKSVQKIIFSCLWFLSNVYLCFFFFLFFSILSTRLNSNHILNETTKFQTNKKLLKTKTENHLSLTNLHMLCHGHVLCKICQKIKIFWIENRNEMKSNRTEPNEKQM